MGEKYGIKGNVSVPPPVILKLMVLLVFYNVRSERELMETVPERLDWLWFLGYDFDSEVPNHSVLSKARCRWGVKVFRNFFERVVLECVESGLVEGNKIFMDSSLIDADASNNSVVDTHSLKRHYIQVLIIHGTKPRKSTAMEMTQEKSGNNLVYRSVQFTDHTARFAFLRKIDIRTYCLAKA